MCGEYGKMANSPRPPSGSPPRVRGILHLSDLPDNGMGITPACAGNTLDNSSTRFSTRDHPRVCGEYLNLGRYPSSKEGSPPRVRGIQGKNAPAKD